MWLLFLACPHRELDPVERATQIAEAAEDLWRRRDEIGLVAAGEPLVDAHARFPGAPAIAWKLTRVYVARGVAAEDPATAERLFASGREAAIACLDQGASFAAWHTAGDWSAAAATIPPVRRPCAAWGALAWVRWMEVHGAAASAIDLPAIDALIAAAAEADGDQVAEVAAWADGVLAALRPTWAGQDLDRARSQLAIAARGDPRSLLRAIDRYRWVLAPLGPPDERAAALDAIRAAEPRYPEEIKARRELLAAP